jgi:hypothetical protein
MCCCSTRIVQIGGGGNNPFTFSITSGDTPYNGGAGIVPMLAGDFKNVKLHGVWGSGVSSTWLTSGDL